MSNNKSPNDYRNFSGTNQIFNPYNDRNVRCEITNSIHDIEKRLIQEIVNIVVDVLDIGWQDRDGFKRLLNTSIRDKVEVLMRQYQDFSVDYIGKEINQRFSIDEEVEFNYALHAKLNNHFNTLKKLISGEIFVGEPACQDDCQEHETCKDKKK